jgi:hypothetical protein
VIYEDMPKSRIIFYLKRPVEEISGERLGNGFKSINFSQEKHFAWKIAQLTQGRGPLKIATAIAGSSNSKASMACN